MVKIIVRINDKNSGFTDPTQGVNFSPSKQVQEVKKTPSIVKAIRQGILSECSKKHLEEFQKERKAHLELHQRSKQAANDAAHKASVTLREKFKATTDSLATEVAKVKILKKENEALKAKVAELEAANKPEKDTKAKK